MHRALFAPIRPRKAADKTPDPCRVAHDPSGERSSARPRRRVPERRGALPRTRRRARSRLPPSMRRRCRPCSTTSSPCPRRPTPSSTTIGCARPSPCRPRRRSPRPSPTRSTGRCAGRSTRSTPWPDIERETRDYRTWPRRDTSQRNRLIGWSGSQSLVLESGDFAAMAQAMQTLQERLQVQGTSLDVSRRDAPASGRRARRPCPQGVRAAGGARGDDPRRERLPYPRDRRAHRGERVRAPRR